MRVRQVNPTVASTLNIGAHRKGWKRKEGDGVGEGTEHLRQAGQGQLQILSIGALDCLFWKVKFFVLFCFRKVPGKMFLILFH